MIINQKPLQRGGQHSLAALAGRSRSTIQIWLENYTAGGLAQLLERHPPPGKTSPMAEPTMQAQLQTGLKSGRWRTAGQVAAWLQTDHCMHRAAKSLYYWLGKVRGAHRVPRPCHVQQDLAAAAAFRAELDQNLEKISLPKEHPVRIWVADKSRFGLHAQSRRCWALPGHRLIRPQEQRYAWEYIYGAVEVVEGLAQFQLYPRPAWN